MVHRAKWCPRQRPPKGAIILPIRQPGQSGGRWKVMSKTRTARTLVLLAILRGIGSVVQAAPAPTAAEAAAVKTAIDNATKTCAQAADLCTIVPPTTVKAALACRPAVIALMAQVGRADL